MSPPYPKARSHFECAKKGKYRKASICRIMSRSLAFSGQILKRFRSCMHESRSAWLCAPAFSVRGLQCSSSGPVAFLVSDAIMAVTAASLRGRRIGHTLVWDRAALSRSIQPVGVSSSTPSAHQKPSAAPSSPSSNTPIRSPMALTVHCPAPSNNSATDA